MFFILTCIAMTASAAEKKPYEYYRSIVDRQMFGTPPPGFDPMKMPSEVSKSSQKEISREQAKLQSSVHFSVINVAADGTTVVGFTDNSDPKTPVHHYLKVGEESGGWKVLSADAAESSMTIRKDGVELTLKLGDNSSKTPGAAAVPAVASLKGAESPAGTFRSGLLGGSLRSRRAMREKRMLEQQEAEKREREEERARRDQEREEQRQQLLAIQEELKRQRDEKQAEREKAESQKEGQSNADNNAE